MYLLALDVLGRHRPHLRVDVDLFPRREPNLAAPRGGQQCELERTGADAALPPQIDHELRHLLPRQRRMMLDRLHTRRLRQDVIEIGLPSGGVLAGAVTADGRPGEHRLYAPAQARSRLRLRRPEWLENLDDVPDFDAVNRQRTDDRTRVGVERRLPLFRVLRVLEAGLARLVTRRSRLVERETLRRSRAELRLHVAARCDWIDAIADLFARGAGAIAGLLERDVRKPTEADVRPAVADLDAEDPAPRTAWLHL